MKRRLRSLLRAVAVGSAVLIASSALVATSPPTPAQAITGADFNPANIISDANFFDGNAMTQQQIQAFLDSMVGVCGNANCLKTKTTTTTSRPADAMCSSYTGAPNELTSTIIFKVQQACGISARVLLVTLQKEQSLITLTAPSDSRVDRAMGYACPDNPARPGWCDPAYAGLYNQIYRAAWQYKRYGNPPGTTNYFTWYPVGRASNIAYKDNNPGCGFSSVTIANKATAALYYYTPYQPNAAALGNLRGLGDTCSTYGNRNFWVFYSDWFGSPTGPSLLPIGNFESGTATIDSATLRGWVLDPETADPIDVHLYVNGQWGGAFTASKPRADIAAAYPSYGPNHGFEMTFPVGLGTFEACIYAINVGVGYNQLVGCRSVSTPSGPPFGGVNGASALAGTATVSGWVIDPDTPEPTRVHVYVNGNWGGDYLADVARDDVAAAYPGYGNAHGFTATVPVVGGSNEVCAFGINVGGGYNQALGCVTVRTPTGPPFGNLESTVVSGNQATLNGWAADPDQPSTPVAVHVYVNGGWGGAFTANGQRADVGAAYPGYGDQHGFSTPVTLAGGTNQVCAFAINIGAGYNQQLGCRTVTLPSGSPFGNIEWTQVSGTDALLGGWAIDPDTAQAVQLHVYVNGAWGGIYTADALRADVGSAYPGYGANHGFSIAVPVPAGSSNVCVYGINVGVGYNQAIGCRVISR